MTSKSFMLIAGEPSGDLLGAELVPALRKRSSALNHSSLPIFIGAGGAKMSAAGVDLAFDLTQHAVTGITDVMVKYFKFRRLFHQLLALAIERKPDAVIGVDFGGFNLRFGHAVKKYVCQHPDSGWSPKIIQLVSPQVWASRPKRADLLAADYDLLLSIFPFEKDWYEKRVPNLRVEFIGHPMLDRISRPTPHVPLPIGATPTILLLPGSRTGELRRHLPVILPALKIIRAKLPDIRAKMVLPSEKLVQLAKSLGADFDIQIGNLPQALAQADVAIASTGTVTMECAFFGLPTVTLYRTSFITYEIGKRLVTVNSLTMPNLLAGEEVYPEFIQNAATPENIANTALELLQNDSRRQKIGSQLKKIISSLGEPGATDRAAAAILSLFP